MASDYEQLRRERMEQVDDETRQIYERIGPGFGIREMGVEAFRQLFKQMLALGGTEVASGVEIRTAAVPGPAGDIPARLYLPAGEEPLGVYVHTHGGGWIAWEGLDGIDAHNSQLAREWGCAVVHVDFRVPPEHRFPAAVDDCWAAVEWVAENGAEHRLDASRVAIGGGCTGANLAAAVALMARDAGGPEIKLEVLDSPQLDTRCDYRSHFEFATGYGLSREDDLFVVEQYLSTPEERWDWRASPVLVDSVRGVAPAIVVAGEYEILRDEARLYAGRLRDAGVEVQYVEGAGQGHGFTSWRNMETGEYTRSAAEARREIAAMVRRFIGPGSSQ
jgi:acetyl esterase